MIKKRWSKCIAAIGTIMVLNSLGIGAYAFQIEQQGSNLLISGFDLVPENENLYGDFRLHPNDEGFEYYHKALYEKVRKEL